VHAQLHIIAKIKTNIKLLLLAFHEIMNVTKSRNKIENCILLGTKKPEVYPRDITSESDKKNPNIWLKTQLTNGQGSLYRVSFVLN